MTNASAGKTNGADDQGQYWCFISYRHSDNKKSGRMWATWLHQLIETYEVPSDLVGTTNSRGDVIPERIFPVFRDEDELPADADLASPIYRALDGSRCMVVLCSPAAVASTYVANEISYFKKIGRADRTMAAILSGEPNASWDKHKQSDGYAPDAECFPVPLRHPVDAHGELILSEHAEPIAPDFRLADGSEGWTSPEAYRQALVAEGRAGKSEIEELIRQYQAKVKLATLKIIAGILGVALGELTKRDSAYQLARAREKAKIARRWLTAVGTLALLACVAGAFAWMQRGVAIEQRQLAVEREKEAEEALLQSRKSLSRIDLEKAVSLNEAGKASDALAYLDRALRYDPGNRTALLNVYGQLLNRDWPLPAWEIRAGSHEIIRAAFVPSRDEIAYYDMSRKLRFVDMKSGRPSRSDIQMEDDDVFKWFTPSGSNIVASSTNGLLQLVSADSGRIVKRINLRSNQTYPDMIRSADGSRMVVADLNRLHVLDGETLDVMASADLAESEMLPRVAFDPSGARIVVLHDKTAEVWDYSRGDLKRTTLQSGIFVTSATVSPDSRWIVVTGVGENSAVYDGATLEPTSRFRELPPGSRIQFSGDGSFLIVKSLEDELSIRINSDRELRGPTLSDEGDIRRVYFSPDSQFMVIESGNRISIRDTLRDFRLVTEPIPVAGAFQTDCTEDGNGLLVTTPDSVSLWDIRKGSMLYDTTSAAFSNKIVSAANFIPEHDLIALQTIEGTVVLVDASTHQAIGKPTRHRGFAGDAFRMGMYMIDGPPILSPDGEWMLTALPDNKVVPVSVKTGKQLRPPIIRSSVNDVPVLSPDSRTFLTVKNARSSGTLLVHKVHPHDGEEPTELHVDKGLIAAYAYSPDARTIYVASSAGLHAFDSRTGKGRELGDWSRQLIMASELLPVSNSSRLLIANLDTVHVVHRETGEPEGVEFMHGDNISWMIQSRDGRFLYTASEDKSVRIWDLVSLEPVGTPLAIDTQPVCLSLTEDNELLYALTLSGKVYLWDAQTGHRVHEPLDVPQGSHFAHLDERSGTLTIAHQNKLSIMKIGYLGKQNAPDYEAVRTLVRGLAGKWLDDDDHHRRITNRVASILNMRNDGAEQPAMVQWFLADRANRSISPYDSTTVKKWIDTHLRSGLVDGLFQARSLDHGDPEILSKFAVELVAQSFSARGMQSLPEVAAISRRAAATIMDHLVKRYPDRQDVQKAKQTIDKALANMGDAGSASRPLMQGDTMLSKLSTPSRRDRSPAPSTLPAEKVREKTRRSPPVRDPAQTPDPVLLKAAEAANRTLPRMLDDETRYDEARVFGKTMIYSSTLVNYTADEINVDKLESSVRKSVLANTRADENLLAMLGYGYSIEQLYQDKNGEYLFHILITPEDPEIIDALAGQSRQAGTGSEDNPAGAKASKAGGAKPIGQLNGSAMFNYDRWQLLSEGATEISGIMPRLKAHDGVIRVVWHSGNQKPRTEAYNKQLSHKRAEALIEYMVREHGLPADKLIASGIGLETETPPAGFKYQWVEFLPND